MTTEEIISRIHGSYASGTKHGLTNMTALLETLNWQGRTPMVHVAGTNGKGSTCAMVERILREAGFHTGLYTSPFLQVYQERIRLDGRPVGDDLLIPCGERVLKAAENLAERGIHCTPFELGTALALTVFETAGVNAAVIEVGLGGRLDPTNVIQPTVCAIASIGMDHMAMLGDTPEQIAVEKAGIMKHGVPVVAQPQTENVERVLKRCAAEAGTPLTQLKTAQILAADVRADGSTVSLQLRQRWDNLTVGLPGRHQLLNAMTAVALVEQLRDAGWYIPDMAAREGLRQVRWPARLEWCGHVLLDGAHNAQGVQALASFVHETLGDQHRVLLTGVLSEKATPDMLDALASIAPAAVCVTPDSPRAMSAEELAANLKRRGVNAVTANSPEEALTNAGQGGGLVIAAGSLYLMGQLRSALHLEP